MQWGSNRHPVTSETLANMLMTNPVVVRRTMALLRQAGYVSAIKGHNGGWLLATPLTDITLFDIHQALGEKNLFVIGLTDEHSNCPIEHAVNSALQNAMDDAEALLLKRFAEVSLAELASQFKK